MSMPLTNANANVYKQQQILTATPEQLILMLYNGCIKFMNDAEKHIEEKDIEKAHQSCIKAQDIIYELVSNLNMDYPISEELFLLYEYVGHKIVMANMKKEVQPLEDAKVVLQNVREGWMEAMKIARMEGKTQNNQQTDASITI